MRFGFRHLQIIAPTALSLGLFWVATFFIWAPAFESSVFERRRELLREIVKITCSLLSDYEQRVADGELSLPDAQARAIARIRILRHGPENKDYIWINDMYPRVIMHPFRSDLEGQDVTGFTDPNGKHLFVEFVKLVGARGGGYVDYMWQWKDDPTRIVPKVSYVEAFEPWGWVVGTGMYTDDVRTEASRLTRTITRVGLVILALVTVLSLYTTAHGTRIESRRRQASDALRESEERLSQAISISRAAVWEADLVSQTVSVGAEAEQILGYGGDDLPITIEQWRGLQHPDEHEELVRVVGAHLRGETPDCFLEGRWLARDGSWKWIYSHARIVDRDERGRPTRLIGTSLDVTQRRHTEEETRRLRNLLSNIVNSMPSVLVGVDPDCMVTQWNREAENATGVRASQANGRPLDAVFPQLAPRMGEVRRAIHSRQVHRSEKVACEVDGQSRLWDIAVYPLATEVVEGAVIRVDDVTQRVKMEEMMVQAEKMMSVGGLAAGMAHEINNPLGGILQGAQNIERRLSLELDKNRQIAAECHTSLDSVRAYLEKRQIFAFLRGIRESGGRAARIVSNMLQFSRRGEHSLVPTAMSELLDRAVDLAASDYDLKKKYDFRHIEIVREYDADMPVVPVVPMEIEQVFLNLLKNGAQAMLESPGDRRPRFILRLKHVAGMAEIDIEDNGLGMSESVRRRAFEPFFTTKAIGVGTGLGLSVSYMLITQNHKGTMEVDSAPDKGTCFTIRLPIFAE